MKIALIEPKTVAYSSFITKLKANFSPYPTLCLQQLVGNTPDGHKIKVISERSKDIKFNIDADLIGITCVTPQASRAYELADEFRRRRKTVVLGGWHPSVLPYEAKQHADAVVIGEADYLWPELIQDFQQKKLKSFYRNKKPVDLTSIKNPIRKVGSEVQLIAAVQASRGCPMGCEFCGVSNSQHGRIFRRRPIDKVIEDLKTVKQKKIWFYDPSLTINPRFTKELFKAMKELDKKFTCFGNIDVLAKDNELLKLSREAGCQKWFIGIESVSQKTIDQLGKKSNKVERYEPSIKKIHDYGMLVIGGFIFGFDGDTPDVFDATVEWVNKLKIDIPEFTILTPYPGTPLFERLKKENRILTYDWSRYTEKGNVVFQPKNMTPETLLNGQRRVSKQINSFSGTIKRALNNKQFLVKTIKNNVLNIF